MDRMKLLLLMHKLEDLVKMSPVIPLTGRVVVPLEEMEDVLNRLREAIPEEAGIGGERGDRGAAGAREQHPNVERASPGADPEVARPESEPPEQVEAEIRRRLRAAERRSEEVRRGADEYADDVLRRLQSSLADAQQVVRRGREELRWSAGTEAAGARSERPARATSAPVPGVAAGSGDTAAAGRDGGA